jgi:hypothetical protein
VFSLQGLLQRDGAKARLFFSKKMVVPGKGNTLSFAPLGK